MIFEVCANSYLSAMNAQHGGADRIELCSALALGGITPSYGVLNNVMKAIEIPVRVLIRPRSGNFVYTASEFETMKTDIRMAKSLGCEGIVSGVLHEDYQFDASRTAELIEVAQPMSFTFHRAFDWVKNPLEVLQQLMALGVDTVLTSGGAVNAERGLATINALVAQGQDQITILPGGGINAQNVHLFIKAGCKAIHASASSQQCTGDPAPFAMNAVGQDDRCQLVTQIEKVKALKEAIINCL